MFYSYSKNIEKYGHLFTWKDAEKKAGRKLDYYNNFDDCFYFDMLIEEIKTAGKEPFIIED